MFGSAASRVGSWVHRITVVEVASGVNEPILSNKKRVAAHDPGIAWTSDRVRWVAHDVAHTMRCVRGGGAEWGGRRTQRREAGERLVTLPEGGNTPFVFLLALLY